MAKDKQNSGKKILVICHLTDSKSNGQISKTRDTIEFLRKNDFTVEILNYGKLGALSSFFKFFRLIKKYEKIVLMPGGKKALFSYTALLSLFKNKQVHYVTIGGWVLNLLLDKKNKRHFNRMKRFKGIYLQNNKAVQEFEKHHFENAYMVSNFSSKKPLSNIEFEHSLNSFKTEHAFNFVFFARVCKEKGVLLACQEINRIKKENPDINISLDIYGEIKDDAFKEQLDKHLIKNQVQYKGVLDSENAIKKLSEYYCMLFPTFYKGEGTPHSIIESYMAGLPVIASNWAYNSEVVEDNKTGLIFKLNTDELHDSIIWAINNKNEICEMRKNCYSKSQNYDIDVLLKPLLDNLQDL